LTGCSGEIKGRLKMGLFSRAAKPNPKIIVDGIDIEFYRDQEWWGFTYRGIKFASFELSLMLPTKVELAGILATVDSLKAEMRSRLKKGLSEWGDGDVKLDDGESCLVDLAKFVSEKTFIASWSGGRSWGDVGVDFTIKDQVIIDEAWGD
jgi:hypothetical protein